MPHPRLCFLLLCLIVFLPVIAIPPLTITSDLEKAITSYKASESRVLDPTRIAGRGWWSPIASLFPSKLKRELSH